MAGTPAPDTRRVGVRNVESDEVTFVLPIDAREMVASGAYVSADDVEVPAPPAPPSRTAHQERMVEVEELATNKRSFAHAVDAKEMIASGGYAFVSGPSTPAIPSGGTPSVTTALEFPPIEQLESVLGAITDADVLLAMEAKDDRPESKALYEARFNELANTPRQ